MEISVIIPTLNGEKFIKPLIDSLKRQTVSPKEIIIIDSSSDDSTVRIAQIKGCITKVIDRKAFDHGGTRNLGESMASGDVIVFMTQDAIPRNEKFLGNLTSPLAEPRIAASFARQVAKEDATPIEKFTREFNYPSQTIFKDKDSIQYMGIKAFFFSDVSSAVRKDAFVKVGRFPEKIIMNEDMILAARLILEGFKVAYVSEAEVIHSHNYNFAQQFKRNFDIGVSHNRNRWLLEHARAEGEGLKYVKGQFAFLMKNSSYRKWIPYAMGLTIAKYSGYKMGLWEDIIPLNIKKRFSMHRGFW